MLSITSGKLKIYAYTRPTDMRKGFAGLSGIIRSEFQADPTDGSLFLFLNSRRDRMPRRKRCQDSFFESGRGGECAFQQLHRPLGHGDPHSGG
jgi:transposase